MKKCRGIHQGAVSEYGRMEYKEATKSLEKKIYVSGSGLEPMTSLK
jgi:hypothetical protein